MKRWFSWNLSLFLLVCMLLSLISGCTSENVGTPEKKVTASLMESELDNIYDVLEDYPGLENFFTYGDLEISEFEERLFGDFLGKKETADILVSMMDLFPILIDTGTTAMQPFSKEVQAEMGSKGPVPDFISTLAVITKNIVAVEDDKIIPFYSYLNKLDEMEKKSADKRGSLDYILDMLTDITGYLNTLDEGTVNQVMNFLIVDLMEMRISEEGEFDFADVEMLIEKFSTAAPEGVIEILEGLRALFYDDDFKTNFADLLNRLGALLGDEKVFAEIKAIFENIDKRYDRDSLGELIDRFWDEGPIVGPETEMMEIDRYGKDGKQAYALRELLMAPQILNQAFETFYHFQEEGFGFDRVDEQLIRMINSDPFCFDRKGEGEFGGGEFYSPTKDVSYKNFSCLRGLVAFLSRWNIPFTFTCPFIYQTEKSDDTRKFIKRMIPNADSISLGSFIWADVYEKDAGSYMGNGHPVKEKRGYGIMVNGTYVAPSCPALLTAGNLPLFLMADAAYHGPHDNIYDNLRWLNYERNVYMIIDLVQLAPHIPILKNTLLPFFKLMGIKQLPVTVVKVNGALGIINLEVKTVLENLHTAMSNDLSKSGMPEWMIKLVIDTLKQYLPMGSPLEGTDRVYLLPRDVRDVAAIVYALSYFDSNAFHLDRFLDPGNPDNYNFFYDIRNYTYENNREQANPLWNILGALCVSSYLSYKEVADPFPLSMDFVDERQNAAIDAFGLIFPMGFLANIFTPFTEMHTNLSIYNRPDTEILPMFAILEPLLAMESTGAMDKFFELLAVLGKPELKKAREKLTGGIAKVVCTIEKDSASPYTIAAEILETPQKASENPERWDTLAFKMEAGHSVLDADSTFEIVDDIVKLVEHLTGVNVTDEDFRMASHGLVDVLAKSGEEKVFTRAAIHMSTILDEVNKMHIWEDAIDVMGEALAEEGIIRYIISGVEKDPEVPWRDVLSDTDTFLHSELMLNYEEGSFWKDVYYLLDFLSDAVN